MGTREGKRHEKGWTERAWALGMKGERNSKYNWFPVPKIYHKDGYKMTFSTKMLLLFSNIVKLSLSLFSLCLRES